MAVLGDRQDEAVGRATLGGFEAGARLHRVPAEVRPGGRACRPPVDLLPRALAHVGDPQVVGRPVEREAPRVAQSEGPDLGPRARPADERVVGGYPVRGPARRARVDPEQLAEEGVEPLAVPLRVAAGPAVARGDPEEPVRADGKGAAVVIAVGLVDPQEDALARRVGRVGSRVGRGQLAHDRVAVAVGVVHVQEAVDLERGREGKAEEPALAARVDPIREVEVRLGDEATLPHHADAAGLFDDEEAPAAVAGVADEERTLEPVDERLELDRLDGRGDGRWGRWSRGRRRRGRGGGGRRVRRHHRRRPGGGGWSLAAGGGEQGHDDDGGPDQRDPGEAARPHALHSRRAGGRMSGRDQAGGRYGSSSRASVSA